MRLDRKKHELNKVEVRKKKLFSKTMRDIYLDIAVE